MFNEKQLLFASISIYKLHAIINTLHSLLYPFKWKHLYLPYILPNNLKLLTINKPYIAGVHSCFLATMLSYKTDNLFIIDLDNNQITTITKDQTLLNSSLDHSIHNSSTSNTISNSPATNSLSSLYHLPNEIRDQLRNAWMTFLSKLFLVNIGNDLISIVDTRKRFLSDDLSINNITSINNETKNENNDQMFIPDLDIDDLNTNISILKHQNYEIVIKGLKNS